MDGVELSLWRLGDDTDIALAAARALLSPDEAARAAQFHFDPDRDRFTRARGLLRQALAEATAGDAAGLVFSYGPAGKPALSGGPAFNLSHSGDRAALAIAPSGAVGVDVELLQQRPSLLRNLPGLCARCFTDHERGALDAAPDQLARFLQFWTAKEALMKLTGEGLGLDPKSIALELDSAGNATGYVEPAERATGFGLFDVPGLTGAVTWGV
ncbi:MAG: 4'-phosphopantetheinyl transferase superfamily protein [Pseudomonadota bacterium]